MIFNPLIEQAIELAAEWHDGTYRKSRWRMPAFLLPNGNALRVPVMAHLTAVAMTLQRADWDDETIAAGFLHDLLEDLNRHRQTFVYAHLCDVMGPAIADRVKGVTEQKLDAQGEWRTWRVRKEGYIATLKAGSVECVAISLADKLHNLWTMNQALSENIDIFKKGKGRHRLSAGPEAQLWYFTSVLDVAYTHNDTRLEPLQNRVAEEIEQFKVLTSLTSDKSLSEIER